jgi:hypothetical protein
MLLLLACGIRRFAEPARHLGSAEYFIDQERGRVPLLQLQAAPLQDKTIPKLQALRINLIDFTQAFRARVVPITGGAQKDVTGIFGQNRSQVAAQQLRHSLTGDGEAVSFPHEPGG